MNFILEVIQLSCIAVLYVICRNKEYENTQLREELAKYKNLVEDMTSKK